MKFKCKKCGQCCKNFGGGFLPLWEWEVDKLKKIIEEKFISPNLEYSEIWLDEKSGLTFCFQMRLAHEPCPFLRDNKCVIYKNRPLVCRCFPLHYNPANSENKLSFGNCPYCNLKKFLEKQNSKKEKEIRKYEKFFGKNSFKSSFKLNEIEKSINEIMEKLIRQEKIKIKKLEKTDLEKYPEPSPFFEFLVKAKLMDENTKEKMIKYFRN